MQTAFKEITDQYQTVDERLKNASILAVNNLFNLYVSFFKWAHSLFSETDSDLSAVKTGLSLLIHAVCVQSEIIMQAVHISFVCIIHDINMYRTTSLYQTD